MCVYTAWSVMYCAHIGSKEIPQREPSPTPLPSIGALAQKLKKLPTQILILKACQPHTFDISSTIYQDKIVSCILKW